MIMIKIIIMIMIQTQAYFWTHYFGLLLDLRGVFMLDVWFGLSVLPPSHCPQVSLDHLQTKPPSHCLSVYQNTNLLTCFNPGE